MTPRISVIIPSYNHSAFLGQAIESVLGQTFEDFELIIGDDGSTDDSLDIAQAYQDARISVHQNEVNLGTYGNLNSCLERCRGEWVAVLNSDDYWMPEKLAHQLALIDRYPECSMSYTLGDLTDLKGNLVSGEDFHRPFPLDELQSPLACSFEMNRVLASSVLFRRGSAAFEPRLKYTGDWALLLKVLQLGPATFVREPMTVWRQHETNTFRNQVGMFLESLHVREAVMQEHSRWYVPWESEAKTRQMLALCAVIMHSNYVLAGDSVKAKEILIFGLAIDPEDSTLKKRAALKWLPNRIWRMKLWQGTDCTPFEEAYRKTPNGFLNLFSDIRAEGGAY